MSAFIAEMDKETFINQAEWPEVILQHPTACVANSGDTFNIIWDSGASMCVTNDKSDFEGATTPVQHQNVDGINSQLRLEARGTVCWNILDSSGKLRPFRLPAYYAPNARQRLLSTTTISRAYPNNEIKINTKRWKIKGNPNKPEESDVDVVINPINNLPTSTCLRPNTVNRLAVNFAEDIFNTKQSNHNLCEPKKELLRWHCCLGHMGFRTVQFSL